MYEKTYGYLYEELGTYPRTADIARAIRADIKRAKSEGLLPPRWTYTVRSRNFAGGCAVDVMVKNCPDAWQECDGTVPGSRQLTSSGAWVGQSCGNVWCKGAADLRYAHAAEVHWVLTEEAMAAKMTLDRIHGAYNHTGSDLMSDYVDVRYYGHVTFDR
jgi:hypothetical protein